MDFPTLIEPVQSGATLLEDIRRTQVGAHAVAIWWLGQSGFLLKSSTGLLLVDPYLSEHLTEKYRATSKPHIRMTRSPCRGKALDGVDLVLASHKHSDHLDPGTLPALLQASKEAILGLPESLLEHGRALGLPPDRMLGLTAGRVIEHRDFRIRPIPSAHEDLATDEQGRHLYLGFVIEVAGLRLYHSGDTLVYEGLTRELGPHPYDILFLPINGRDPARGVSGNMSAAEAVDLARQVRPRFVVPHHYDMFTFNTVPVADFEREATRLPGDVRARVLQCGEHWEVHQ